MARGTGGTSLRRAWGRAGLDFLVGCALAGSLSASFARPTAAQSLGGFLGIGRTAYHDLAGPRLFGAELGTFRVAGVSLRAGARWAKESRTTSGTVCDGYWPSYPGCRSEEVRSDVTLRSRWIGASYRHESSKLFADVGVRRVANRLRADYRGVQTGRGAGMMVPEEVLASWGFDLGAGMRLSPTSPVAVTITYSTDRVEVWNACATDVGTPFCQAPSRLHALTLGLEIAPWQRPLR